MLGIIGGSGLYDLDGLQDREVAHVDTPFGRSSASVVLGRLGRTPIAFLPRHGDGHHLTPTEAPYRANIYALRMLGVTHVLSVSAVGSLTESLPPLSLVTPDGIIDRTVSRDRTFFDRGIVAHVGLAEPFCADFARSVRSAGSTVGVDISSGGTYVCIEGPQFSTRAESHLYRGWGASIIGMTAMPEARLAREAELHYAQLAMVTDFDVWHENEDAVTVEMVIANLQRNTANARNIIRSLCEHGLPETGGCGCDSALASAIITRRDLLEDDDIAYRVGLFAGKYLVGSE